MRYMVKKGIAVGGLSQTTERAEFVCEGILPVPGISFTLITRYDPLRERWRYGLKGGPFSMGQHRKVVLHDVRKWLPCG